MYMIVKAMLGCIFLAIPFLVGGLYRSKSPVYTYLAGQITMWAGFQMVAVPAVFFRFRFNTLFMIFLALMIIMCVIGVLRHLKVGFDKPQFSFFIIPALGVIAYQCCQYIFKMHLDEDDARWIAEANDALVKNMMLLNNPATGEYMGRFVGEMVKDVFSPWSMHLAFWSRFTGIRAVTFAHTVYPPVLLLLCYMAYWEIGKRLFKGKHERAIFLLMVSVINMFMAGNPYTQSVFTLTRIWQGKAVVAAVMIPAFMMLFLDISGYGMGDSVSLKNESIISKSVQKTDEKKSGFKCSNVKNSNVKSLDAKNSDVKNSGSKTNKTKRTDVKNQSIQSSEFQNTEICHTVCLKGYAVVWIPLLVCGIAACLMSGMGIAIGGLMMGVYGLYGVAESFFFGIKRRYKGWWISLPLWLACLVFPVVYGLGYMWLKG